jgi:hypothetical protein
VAPLVAQVMDAKPFVLDLSRVMRRCTTSGCAATSSTESWSINLVECSRLSIYLGVLAPLIPYSGIGINSSVRVANSVMRCSSARAREELICAKRTSLGAVVLGEAIDFDELGDDIAGATASAGVAQP